MKKLNERATKILAELIVENKSMTLEEIAQNYNAIQEDKLTRLEVFEVLTYLLADGFVKQVHTIRKETKYKITVKTKRMI